MSVEFLSGEYTPLASRMRPSSLEEMVGQAHLIAPQKPLYQAVKAGKLHSMILWGAPGTGKTTLAQILAQSVDAEFKTISAVLAGVKEIREIATYAKLLRGSGRATVLFVDEVHRFNKAQQDAFLPHVESGEITLIGATTENPSFQLNNALLSRARVYLLKLLQSEDLVELLKRALRDEHRGLGKQMVKIDEALLEKLALAADGDARKALNLLEIATDSVTGEAKEKIITAQTIEEVLKVSMRSFDNRGDLFYDQISALHKSVRGSDPDAALYWFVRMLDGGCDPQYILRRVVRMASEDIGNADPRALTLAIQAWETYDRLGSPEGDLAIAQAIIYCAVAAKSNAVYVAMNEAQQEVKKTGSLEVPLQLRNAPTTLMREMGAAQGYRYAHDEVDAFAAGAHYFPDALKDRQYYHPVSRGMEIKIKQKLDHLRHLNKLARTKEHV